MILCAFQGYVNTSFLNYNTQPTVYFYHCLVAPDVYSNIFIRQKDVNLNQDIFLKPKIVMFSLQPSTHFKTLNPMFIYHFVYLPPTFTQTYVFARMTFTQTQCSAPKNRVVQLAPSTHCQYISLFTFQYFLKPSDCKNHVNLNPWICPKFKKRVAEH